MPGYANLFDSFFRHQTALAAARLGDTPQALLQLGLAGLNHKLREQNFRFQARTLDKIFAWASPASPNHQNLQEARSPTNPRRTREDPHRLDRTAAHAAFLEPGALSNHHRRIRQFGDPPLMYYQYGET